MAGNDVQIQLTAKDGASNVFKTVGRSAQDMGKQVDTAGKTSEASLGKMSKAGAVAGAALASLGGVLSLATHANAEAEASQARLTTAIENSGHSVDEYQTQLDAASKKALQLGFDDEDAADAIAKMTTATGDAGQAISDLSIAEDIARARNIDLASATNLVIAAEQGRIGALQRVGIAVDASMSKEQVMDALRAKFAGNAEAYSTTTAAGFDRLKNSTENALEAIGAHLGPAQELLMLMPALNAGFVGVSAAVGALVPMMTEATGAAAVLDIALGPVGLVVAAVAATAALGVFLAKTQDTSGAMLDTSGDVTTLEQTLADLAAKGLGSGALNQVRAFEEAIQDMGRRSNEASGFLKNEQEQIDIINASLDYGKDIRRNYADLTQEDTDRLIAERDALEANKQGYEDTILTNKQYLQVQQDIADIYAGGNPLNFDLVQQHLQDLTADMQAGGETADQYVKNVADLKAQEDTYGLSLDQIAAKQRTVNTLTADANVASLSYLSTQTRELQTMQTMIELRAQESQLTAEANVAALSYLSTQTREFETMQNMISLQEQQAALAAGSTTQAAGVTVQATDLNNLIAYNAKVKEAQGAYYGLADGITTAKDAQAAFKQTQDGIITSQDQYTGQLSEYQTQLGYITDAETLLNQRKAEGQTLTAAQTDFLNRADDAQARLTGGTEDATIALGLQAEQYAENMRIGDEMNQAMGDQTSSTNVLTDTLNNLIAALQGIPGYVNTYINADTSDLAAGVAGAQEMLSTIDGRTVTTYVNVEFGHVAPGALGYQHGGRTPLDAGHAQHGAAMHGSPWWWVGEQGPELTNGRMVLPHTASVETSRGTGGGGVVMHNPTFNVYPTDFRDFQDKMRSYNFGYGARS